MGPFLHSSRNELTLIIQPFIKHLFFARVGVGVEAINAYELYFNKHSIFKGKHIF